MTNNPDVDPLSIGGAGHGSEKLHDGDREAAGLWNLVSAERPPALAERLNPYVGPRSIGGPGHEKEKLYGRAREVNDLMDRLIAERIVLLYSPSGAGKTSLLQAGLKPALEAEAFVVRPLARVHHAPPPPGSGFTRQTGNRYVLSTLVSLLPGVAPAKKVRNPDEFMKLTLAEFLGPAKDCEVLIFDQFEELLTVDPADREEKLEFFTQLGEAMQDKRRWLICAMREDYLAGLDPYLNQVPTRFSNTFRLDLLKQDAAMEAMRGPAAREGVEFTLAAAQALAANLSQIRVAYDDGRPEETRASLYIEPVHLQVVCRRLWQGLPPGTAAITEQHLASAGDVDAALRGFYDDSLKSIKGVSERQVRAWFSEQLITPQKTRGQALHSAKPTRDVHAALTDLLSAHLARADRRMGNIWYELAHDRLIQPVLASNAEWFEANLNLLQKTAAVWASQQKPEVLLLTGADLHQAQQWAAGHAEALNDAEREYLADSAKFQAALDEKQRQEQRLRLALAESDLARVAHLKATMPSEAFAYLARALRLNPASSVARTWAAACLAWLRMRVPIRDFDLGKPVSRLSFSGDGRRLLTAATYSREGYARVWDVATGEPAGPAFDATAYDELSLNFDGTMALATPKNPETGFIGLVDTATAAFQQFERFTPPAWATFSSDGKYILVKGAKNVFLLDAAGQRIRLGGQPSRKAGICLFSSDGTHLVIADECKAQAWDIAADRGWELELPFLIENAAINVANRLVALSMGVESVVWNLETGKLQKLDWGETNAGDGEVRFLPDGQVMLVTPDEVCRCQPDGTGLAISLADDVVYQTGAQAAVSPGDHWIFTWDPHHFDELNQVFLEGRLVNWVPSRDHRRMAVATNGRMSARLWDVTGNLPVGGPPRPADLDAVSAPEIQLQRGPAVFSPDARRVLVLPSGQKSAGESPELFDQDYRLIAEFVLDGSASGPDDQVRAVFSPDSRLLAIGGANTIQVFDAETGQEIGGTLDYPSRIFQMTFTPDSNFLLASLGTAQIGVWEARTGIRLWWLFTSGPANRLAVSDDGSRLVAVTEQLGLVAFDLQLPEAWSPALAELAEAAGGLRVGESGRLEPISVADRRAALDRLLASAQGGDSHLAELIRRWIPGD